jgi:hypothetical protein
MSTYFMYESNFSFVRLRMIFWDYFIYSFLCQLEYRRNKSPSLFFFFQSSDQVQPGPQTQMVMASIG